MNKFKTMAMLVVLGLTFASCTKENVADDHYAVATAASVTYFINGQQCYANPQTEEDWSAFLDRMMALAEEGWAVRFMRTGTTQQANAAKEKVVYTTTSYADAKAWALQKILEGYEVTITFDRQTGKYTCIATR